MITFKKFLESDDAPKQKFFDIVREQCSEFLSETHGAELVRGMKGVNLLKWAYDSVGEREAYDYFTPQKDRAPVDTPKVIHHLIDDWMFERFGWRGRSEGVFCASPKSDVFENGAFGAMFEIYPVDGYKFIWSPKVYDLYVQLHKGIFRDLRLTTFGSNSQYEAALASEETKEKVISFLEDARYTDKDLDEAIHSGAEIMLQCDQYIAKRYYG